MARIFAGLNHCAWGKSKKLDLRPIFCPRGISSLKALKIEQSISKETMSKLPKLPHVLNSNLPHAAKIGRSFFDLPHWVK